MRSIRRMTKLGIPSYSDDPDDPRCDWFALDDERLVRDREDVFHTMRESFQRIEPRRDPATGSIRHWVVHRPDGSTLWFGSDPDAGSQRVDPSSGRPLEWRIDRAQDRNGNFVRYRYRTAEGSVGIAYLAEIAYSFRGDGGESLGSPWPRSDTVRRIHFHLEARPDPSVSYRGGVRTVLAHRLDSIEARRGEALVGLYDLVYLDETESGAAGAHPNGASLLHGVVRVGADGTSTLPADLYSYSGSGPPAWEADSTASLLESRLGELLGGGGFNLSTGNWGILDVNGDAAADLVFTGPSRTLAAGEEPLNNQRVYLNHKVVLPEPSGSLPVDPFFHDQSTDLTPVYHVPIVWDPDRNPRVPAPNGSLHVSRPDSRWVDYNGDGRVDLVWGFSDETRGGNGAVLELWRNDGIDWTVEPDASEWWATLPRPPTVYFSQCSPMRVQALAWGHSVFADVNGDGLPELLFSAVSGAGSCATPLDRSRWDRHEVFLNRGTGRGFEAEADPSWSAELAGALEALETFAYRLVPFDLNGDGLTDLGADVDGDGALDGPVLVNTGRGWVDASTAGIEAPPGLRPVDLDGDGLVDHAGSPPLLNAGSRFRPAPSLALPPPFDAWEPVHAMVDLDGDGIVELLRAEKSDPAAPSRIRLLRSSPVRVPEGLLVRIDKATGGVVKLEYDVTTRGSCFDPYADGGCHARLARWSIPDQIAPRGLRCHPPLAASEDGLGCLYPVERLPIRTVAVRSVSVDDANGNVRIDSYDYQGGFYDPEERELRGFGRVTETPPLDLYEHPRIPGLGVFNLLKRRTYFYLQDFLRGAWAKVEVSRVLAFGSEEEELLERDVNHYALTRADLSGTAWLRAFDFAAACEEFDGDADALPADEGASAPPPGEECSLFNLERSTYSQLLEAARGGGGPSLPYAPFRARFEPASRDARLAYLVLPAGRVRFVWDGSAEPLVLLSAQWHDPFGNVQLVYDFGEAGKPKDDRITLRRFATPLCADVEDAPLSCGPKELRNAPSEVLRESGNGVLLARDLLAYDGLPNGSVRSGNETSRISGAGESLALMTRTFAPDTFGLADSETEPFAPGEPRRATLLTYDPSKTFVTAREIAVAPPAAAELERTGLVLATSYDPPGAPPGLGIVHETRDENGAVVVQRADAFGRPTGRSGPAPIGSAEERTYHDSRGFDPARARSMVVVRDGHGNDVAVRVFADGLGRTIRTERDALGPDDQPRSVVQETRYGASGQIELVRRPYFAGEAPPPGTAVYYDPQGRVRFVRQPDGGIQETLYDRLRTRAIDAEGRTTDRIRDGHGQVVEVREHLGGGQEQVTTFRYDPLGRLHAVCDARARSCPEVICDPEVQRCRIQEEDPRHTIVIEYDELGRRRRVRDPDGGEWEYTYRGSGRVASVRDARGSTIAYGYDSLGRLRSEDPGGGADVRYIYGDDLASPPPDSLGRLASVTGPEGTFEYGYDEAGRARVVRWTRAEGGSVHSIVSSYDWLDRVTSTTYPDGETVERRYDRMGVDRIFSAERLYVADVGHDAEGKALRIVYGNGTVRELARRADSGFLEALRDRLGPAADPFLHLELRYDRTGRVTSLVDRLDAAESLDAIAYDALGRTSAVVRGGSPVHYGYDALGNLTSKEGRSLRYEHPSKPHALFDASRPDRFAYDENGNLTLRDGVRLEYDARGRLVHVEGNERVSFGYDHTGERVRSERGAAVTHFLGPDCEIRSLRETDGRLRPGSRLVKTIRIDGTLAARVSTLPAERAALRGRPALLRSAIAAVPAASSSRPSIPDGDLNSDGRLDAADALLMERLTREPAPSEAELARADIAPLDRAPETPPDVNPGDLVVLLRAISGEDVDGDGLGTEEELLARASPFRRDTDRDRIDDRAELARGTDPGDPDVDGDGIVDGDDPDPFAPAGEEVHWIHTDHLGSVSVLTDPRGAVVRRLAYGVWGELRASRSFGPAPDLEHGFTGQRYDPATGFYYYGARYYDSETGRFLQPDAFVQGPLDPQNLNRYTYAANNPLNAVDPSGNFFAFLQEASSFPDLAFQNLDFHAGTYLYDSLGQGGFTGISYTYHRDSEGHRSLVGEVYAFGRSATFSRPRFYDIQEGKPLSLAAAADRLRSLPIERRNLYTQGIWANELQISNRVGGDPSFLERAGILVGSGIFLFNPSDGRLNDLVEALIQKFLPGATELDRTAAALIRAAGGVNVARGFSQGALTIRNGTFLLGLTGGAGMVRTARLVGSPSSFFTAWFMTEVVGGGRLDFRASAFDPVSGLGHPELLPTSVVASALCGGLRCYHDDLLYGR
jgi:RHS repeat-associated protein